MIESFDVEYVLSATLGAVVVGRRDDAPRVRLPVEGPWDDWLGFTLVVDAAMPPDEAELRGVDRAGHLFRQRVKLQEVP